MAKEIFSEMTRSAKSALEIIHEKGLTQISDRKELSRIVDELLTENRKNVKIYLAGREKLFGFLVGQVTRKTEGKANPELVNELLKAKLSASKYKW
jgi:aspartyl-tRNA(Asn)/glutamyl-tRNA(Gln) amidotransferase subunit B